MAIVAGLRSARIKVGGMVYFGRMLDKMRLHAVGKLPSDYVSNLGQTQPRVFDAVCCRFLGVNYEELKARVLSGCSDEEAFAWCQAHGKKRDDFEIEMFNAFLSKRGWKDEVSDRLRGRVAEFGLDSFVVETFFDLFDADEGRGVPRSV